MVKKLFRIITLLLILIAALIWITNTRVEKLTDKLVFTDLYKVPYNKVGLLLGTSKYLSSGQLNPYFTNRISATAELFYAKKIDFIVVSGDNRRKSYNEPQEMKNELLK